MRYKISVIGAFGFGREMRDGQTVKTKETYKLLTEKYGKEAVYAVDTLGWSKAPWRLFHGVVCAARNSECVIMLPARNALKVIPYLLLFTKKNSTKVFYSVIGGWLPEFLQDKPQLSKLLKRLNGIWVETNTMKRKLDADGFGNITVVPNFKDLNVLEKEELVYPELSPMRLCIFSRINKMKGIEDAVRAIKEVNAESGRTVYTLDMYGLISDEFKQDFDKLCKEAPSYIQYKGCIPPEQSVGVIKNYFALLFPTLYPTEGIPGTIIDAYSAGVPVISAKWNSFVDIVDESKTGIGFTLGDFNSLKSALKEIAIAPEVLCNMKPECLKKAKVYSPETTKELILRLLTRGGGVKS